MGESYESAMEIREAIQTLDATVEIIGRHIGALVTVKANEPSVLEALVTMVLVQRHMHNSDGERPSNRQLTEFAEFALTANEALATAKRERLELFQGGK